MIKIYTRSVLPYIYVFRLDDVKQKVDQMEKAVRFRITAARDNEIIKRLYDTNREKLLFALPPKVKSVGFLTNSPVLIN